MSSTGGLMSTEKGGEQTQYEGEHTHMDAPNRSGGQFGNAETATDSKPEEQAQQNTESQSLSEGGMGGMTTKSEGGADQAGYGQMKDQSSDTVDPSQDRVAEGYGGDKDVSNEIGA